MITGNNEEPGEYEERCVLDGVLDPPGDFLYALCHESLTRVSRAWLVEGFRRQDVRDLLVSDRAWVFQNERPMIAEMAAEHGFVVEWNGMHGASSQALSYMGPPREEWYE